MIYALNHDESGSERKKSEIAEKQQVFEKHISTLRYTGAVGSHRQKMDAMGATHTSVVETAGHFCRSYKTWGELLWHKDYEGHGRIPNNLFWWMNAINNIPRVPPKERSSRLEPRSLSGKVMLRQEQKAVNWMMDVVLKFLEALELVLDSFIGMLATSKACLQLLEHRRFVGCEEDSMRFSESLPSLVEVFASYFLSTEFNVAEKEKTM